MDKNVRIQLIASPTFVKAIDDWRRQQVDLPNRSEAIRRLVLERAGLAKINHTKPGT